jgi:eukaryotic-like serine/threonine-protein kinase
MAYCYECGEQVAENDTFCPYCGITLMPVALAGEEDDSLSKTIVARQPQAAAKPDKAISDAMPAPKSDEIQIKERLNGDKTGDSANEISAADSDLKNESEEMSPDQIERELDLAEEAEKAAVAEELRKMEKMFDSKPDFPINEVEAQSAKIVETLQPVAGTSENLPACAEGENSEFRTQYSSDSTDANDNNEIKPVFVSTEGETIENGGTGLTSNANEEIDSTSQPVEPSRVDLGIFNLKEEMPSANTEFSNIPEQPISMPEAVLPAAENNPPSRFDSVSIMEKPSTDGASSAAGRASNPMHSESSVENSVEEGISGQQKEGRSYTTPNFAGSDTGGKSKKKLQPLDEGTVLNGRYEIIRKIGGGGMGAVYLASDKNLGGVLRAVKEMVQSYIEDEQQEKAVNDFKRESLLLTSLDHQSIPTIYDYFFDEKEARFYLVMKYISGGDLAGRLRSAPESRIDEMSVTQWSIQIADVLDYLHNRQPPIVYRDLKPANIMVDGNSGRVMLIDFGIARWVNKEEKGVTAVGTMGYAPPELFSGNVEARSDIYSLGSTMFHLLTGADPQSNPLLIFDFQKHPRPRQINPQLSDQMERILMRAVEYNADKRFATAAEMRKALEEHLENLKSKKVTYGVKEAPASIALSDQPVFCGFCGQKIVATDMFCAFCGAKQPLAQHGVHSFSEGYAPAPLTAKLLIIGTNELEQPSFKLEKDDNLVGRRDPMSNIFPEVDLSKFDPQTKISRRHARIWREGSEFMVEDLGSSNGTYILPVVSNTMRLQPHQPQILANGDKIKLGDTTLHFILG